MDSINGHVFHGPLCHHLTQVTLTSSKRVLQDSTRLTNRVLRQLVLRLHLLRRLRRLVRGFTEAKVRLLLQRVLRRRITRHRGHALRRHLRGLSTVELPQDTLTRQQVRTRARRVNRLNVRCRVRLIRLRRERLTRVRHPVPCQGVEAGSVRRTIVTRARHHTHGVTQRFRSIRYEIKEASGSVTLLCRRSVTVVRRLRATTRTEYCRIRLRSRKIEILRRLSVICSRSIFIRVANEGLYTLYGFTFLCTLFGVLRFLFYRGSCFVSAPRAVISEVPRSACSHPCLQT